MTKSTKRSILKLSGWTNSEIYIFEKFNFRCGRCRKQDAVTLHEIVPKSKRPLTWMQEDNRIPLCNDCHIWAHSRGYKNSMEELKRCLLSGTREQTK